MSSLQNPAKVALRKKIEKILENITPTSRFSQSCSITEKILNMPAFIKAERVSIYLSMEGEVNTMDILLEMFKLNKKVFVPSYSGKKMVMLRIKDLEDYENLPLTKWNIKQPKNNEGRENALDNNGGLDLILMPGVAFTENGGRCGHGMGYYDNFLHNYFKECPDRASDPITLGNIQQKLNEKKTILIALAFKEQIVDRKDLPIDKNDVLIDLVVTSD